MTDYVLQEADRVDLRDRHPANLVQDPCVLWAYIDELEAARTELAALKGRTCETCRELWLHTSSDYKHEWRTCNLTDFNCDVFGNTCGAWQAREAQPDTPHDGLVPHDTHEERRGER